ncbi:MerR family transcriptional regulator [Alkalihalophilus lindianensis]|uniref:MerR family transcriptional regulator n=1 Tax=Alkalihalophilus lindianensis TaxID=1630542 RepID=A0ABU3X911_9BACI|nr:MerR family transcriptional regulator [Alkalihalophilus lindianensis]MDV2683954.1 MerR family transcriptional regulator [Alkalihalophilus lindianensis]
MTNNLLTKTKMSELVGWSEANGRRWVKNLKEYIPTVTSQNRIMYTMESLRIMKFFKRLNEVGLTIPEIKQILSKEGLPKDELEEQKIIEQCKATREFKNYNEEIKDTIPSTGEMMIPYLKLIRDGKAYTASEITEKLVEYFKLRAKTNKI